MARAKSKAVPTVTSKQLKAAKLCYICGYIIFSSLTSGRDRQGRHFHKSCRGNKHGAKKCSCFKGHLHHSRGEAGYCNYLMTQERNKEIVEYEIQKRFELRIHGKLIANHYVDFLVTNLDHSQEIHEFKGFATEVWKLKRALTILCYPKIEYKVIKPR